MAKRSEIEAAIRTRVAKVITAPGADRSGKTEGATGKRLPVFAVRGILLSAERAGMGSDNWRMVDRIEVAILARQSDALENAAEELAGRVRDAIMAAPADLGGLVWDLRLAGLSCEVESGETRIARAEIGFDVEHFGGLS